MIRITMNEETRTVSANGKEIKITRKEFQVLKLIVINLGQMCSKQMIYKTIFKRTFNKLTDRALDAHIVSLRRKLGILLGCDASVIRTMRSRGYYIPSNEFVFTLS